MENICSRFTAHSQSTTMGIDMGATTAVAAVFKNGKIEWRMNGFKTAPELTKIMEEYY